MLKKIENQVDLLAVEDLDFCLISFYLVQLELVYDVPCIS